MEKVINGKRYNTDTAQKIAEYFDAEKSQTDLDYFVEELYMKRNKEFFLYGYGNAGSKYSIKVAQNSWAGGRISRSIVR